MRRIAATAGVILLSATSAGGCAAFRGVAEPRSHSLAAQDLPMTRTAASARLGAAWPTDTWWQLFADPTLDALEQEALAGNPSLHMARARVDQAEAVVGLARAALWPSASADLALTRERFSGHDVVPPPFAGTSQTESRLALDFGYEFDFWGSHRAELAAALDADAAARAEAFAARLVLATAVATVYVELARLCDQLEVERRFLEERRQVFELTERLVEAGLGTRVELKQAEAALPASRGRIAALEASAALARHQLASLLGKGPDRALDIGLPHLQPIDSQAILPSRLSADLIGRRPDVEASRLRAEAAAQDIKVAKAGFYPDVNLLAFVGFQSIGLPELMTAGSRIAGVGPAVRLPVFEGGRLRSQLAGRRAQFDLAVEAYNQSVIQGLREVADQLAVAHSLTEQRSEQERALADAREAYELSMKRYQEGVGTYLSVLATEASVLEQEHLGADLRAAGFGEHIHLVRALGGGFQPGVRDSSPSDSP